MPPADRDVRAVEHRPRTIGRRWMSGSASPLADRVPPRRRRSHRPLQLAVRPPPRRRRRAAHRGHRPVPRGGRRDRADPGVARLARARLRRVAGQGRPVRAVPAERAARRLPRGRGAAGRRRARVSLLPDAGGARGGPRDGARDRRPGVADARAPRPDGRADRGVRGRRPQAGDPVPHAARGRDRDRGPGAGRRAVGAPPARRPRAAARRRRRHLPAREPARRPRTTA